VRLPIALASVAQIAITEELGAAMFGVWGGAAAALCLALSPLFFGFGRFLTLDPILAMFVTASLASFYAATRKPALSAGRNWLYLAALFAALGTLTKGPVALVLSGVTALLYLLIERRGRELAQVPWIGCALIIAAVNLPWFAAVSKRNPGFLSFFFVHEHLQRYAVSTEHQWGPYFFVVVVAAGMWPWICFVPIAIADLFRSSSEIPGKEPAGAAGSDDEARRGLRFALIWFAVVFVFFSIPRSKLGSYILPAMPAGAILAGYGLSRMPRIDPRLVSRILAALAAIDMLVAAAAIVAAPGIRELRLVPALRPDLMIGVGAMALGAIVAFELWQVRAAAIAAIGALAFGMIVVLGVMVKARDDAAFLNSYRKLGAAIVPDLRPGCVMASYHHHVQALPFYTGWREALVGYRGELGPWGESPDAADSFIATDDALRSLWASGECVIVVINWNDLTHLGPTLNPPPRQIGREGKKVAITNQASAR
jgi:4-amino-4-deoxy-L-arabinose transferase-like glycosyltransferase